MAQLSHYFEYFCRPAAALDQDHAGFGYLKVSRNNIHNVLVRAVPLRRVRGPCDIRIVAIRDLNAAPFCLGFCLNSDENLLHMSAGIRFLAVKNALLGRFSA